MGTTLPATPTTPSLPVQEPGQAGYGGALASQGNPGQGYFPAHNLPVPTPSQLGNTSNPYQSDPAYAAALAQEQLGLSQSNQALNNLIQQRIISYGDPALASQAGFGLDPQGAAFAQQNYLSGNAELARIDRQHKQNLQSVINALAAHGLVFSGDTGYRTGQEDQAYGNTVYDAQQKALSDILGYRNSTLQQQQGLHQSVIEALQNAYQNYVNNPQFYGAAINSKASIAAPPKTAPKVAPKAPAKAPAKKTLSSVLRNPYVTGEKRFG